GGPTHRPAARRDPPPKTPKAGWRRIIKKPGLQLVGEPADIAPADRRLYAIRDVTATVESLDLITASILSKKLAAAPDALVLDVKTGSGAFMKSREDARALAQALTATANAAGCNTTAIISDMSQPLAASLGNALEVAEIMRVLTGDTWGPLVEISVALGGVLMADAGLVNDAQDGADQLVTALNEGRVAERFGRMIAEQGGPMRFVEDWARFLPEANVIREVPAPQPGYIAEINGEALGLTVVGLGGGRQVENDEIDPAVGLSGIARLGDWVDKGAPIATVHAGREDVARRAEKEVLQAIKLSDAVPIVPDLIHERIG
ncbi:MAG: thymidine phosphorylase, partial [Arenibacterium sp.]